MWTQHQLDVTMQNLIPNPLHPAVVHLPVALAVLLPLFVLGALWYIRRGAPVRSTWSAAVVLMGLLVVSAFVAKQTGEQEEDRVERVVSERSIHTHEEAAELFVLVTVAVLAIGLVGLASGRIGNAGRLAAALGTAAILGAGWNVGQSGGMLVYRDGAASAYASGTFDSTTTRPRDGARQRDEDGSRRGDDR
jgi:uncharacterized membrane protein